MNSIRESVGTGKYFIESIAVCCGDAINISIAGGEKQHIGAVAIAIPTDKFKKRSATTSVICVEEHKEDGYAYNAAKILAIELNCVVTISVGIHVDDANEEDLKILTSNFDFIIEKLKKSLAARNTSRLSYF